MKPHSTRRPTRSQPSASSGYRTRQRQENAPSPVLFRFIDFRLPSVFHGFSDPHLHTRHQMNTRSLPNGQRDAEARGERIQEVHTRRHRERQRWHNARRRHSAIRSNQIQHSQDQLAIDLAAVSTSMLPRVSKRDCEGKIIGSRHCRQNARLGTLNISLAEC